MRLRQFDNKCVQVTDVWGNVFEGICSYNSRSYNAHEIGPDEDGLQISCFVLTRSDIKEVKSLEDHEGPYGKFTGPFGTLEEMTVQDGADLVEEALDSEESVHVHRLLLCIGKYLDPENGLELPDRKEVIEALRHLAAHGMDDDIRKEALQLVERWG